MSLDGTVEAANLDEASRLQLHASLQEADGSRPDEHLAGLCLLLQARSEVDRLAGGEGRVALLLGDDLARLDADAGLEVELTHLLERGERRPDGALGVVLVGERDAEGGHDRVAGELLHRAAVRDDAARHLVEEAGHLTADDLRVAAGEALGGVDEIDEQDGGELALHTTHGTWERDG